MRVEKRVPYHIHTHTHTSGMRARNLSRGTSVFGCYSSKKLKVSPHKTSGKRKDVTERDASWMPGKTIAQTVQIMSLCASNKTKMPPGVSASQNRAQTCICSAQHTHTQFRYICVSVKSNHHFPGVRAVNGGKLLSQPVLQLCFRALHSTFFLLRPPQNSAMLCFLMSFLGASLGASLVSSPCVCAQPEPMLQHVQ